MEVNGQFHAPAALAPSKEPLVPIKLESGWAPEPVWTQWQREIIPAVPGIESSTLPFFNNKLKAYNVTFKGISNSG
jgi:hypothetical protein